LFTNIEHVFQSGIVTIRSDYTTLPDFNHWYKTRKRWDLRMG